MKMFVQNIGLSSPSVMQSGALRYVPIHGQSLSVNVGSLPTIRPNADYCFQFDAGTEGLPNSNSKLIPLRIGQDVTSSMAEVIRTLYDEDNFVFSNPGASGSTIDGLMRGSNPYAKLIAGVVHGKRIADSENKTFDCPAVCFIHGEARMLSFANLSGYGAKLDQLIQELNEDIIEITGQSNPVKLILTQVGTHVSYARYPRIPMVQLDRANVNPNIILARMMYNSDFVADEVHGTTQCYGLTGAKLGLHFVKNIMNGENYTPWINPVGHVFNLGTLTSTLTFNVPTPPLVIDTTEVQGGSDALYDNYGFELYNVVEDETTLANNSIHKATTRITNVQVTGPSTIVVTYDSEPSVGTRLVYGHNGFGWDRVTGGYNTALSSAGRVNGNRGNIRDSMGEIYQYNVRDSSGTVMHDKLHNWCPIFEIVF